MPNTVEELQAQQQQAEKELETRVEEAAEQAAQEAAAQGASAEEVKAAVEKARKEEKDKLYPQITELKESIKEMQEYLRQEREEKEQIKADAEAEKERRRQEKLSDSEKTLEAIRKLEEKLTEEREERRKLDERWEAEKRKNGLEAYRQLAIQAAGNDIIPELVTGNTEEEIDNAVQIAKARYAELAEQFKTKAGTQVRQGMPQSSGPGMEALEEEELHQQLSAVDQDRYLKDEEYRVKIQNELANAYSRAAGRV